METWYQVKYNQITPVVVERYTDKNVWINGRQTQRNTYWRSFFPTWDEAKQHIISSLEEQRKTVEEKINFYNDELVRIDEKFAKVENLKPLV